MNKRTLKLEKYGISKKRYKELCGFCEQYPDWKMELTNHSYIKAVKTDSIKVSGGETSDPTSDTAYRLMKFESNCAMIEKVAKEADKDYWQHLIKAICYEVPLTYLMMEEGLHMSKSSFYEIRRYFFYLLDKEKRY